MKIWLKEAFTFLVGGLLVLTLVSCAVDKVNSPFIEHPVSDESRIKAELGIRAPGNFLIVQAYCRDEEGVMDAFTEFVTKEGIDGYLYLISVSEFPCYDSRYLKDTPPIPVVLVERVKAIRISVVSENKISADKVFEIWRFQDVEGNFGFTWLLYTGAET